MTRTSILSRALRPLIPLAVLLASCEPDTKGATETNVQRAPCKTDEDCGGDIECLPGEGPDASLFCDVPVE
jgi:hypothetical protein